MGHAQPVHGHHGVRPTGVERQVQPSLGRERPSADGDQRTLSPAQQTADHEDRQSAEDLHPHGGAAPMASTCPPAASSTHSTANTAARRLRTARDTFTSPDAAGQPENLSPSPRIRTTATSYLVRPAPLYESDADPRSVPGRSERGPEPSGGL
ncbi:hypothetical protein ACFTY8_24775 [Streptomyces mirabilis]|uniref:hypothetical protein n=1 Tax=Streptomyces mirabilis TaxID=68239 RepID=UPI003631406A